jgi:hypothetical protein
MNVRKEVCEAVDLIKLPHGWVQWRAFLNTAVKLRVP